MNSQHEYLPQRCGLKSPRVLSGGQKLWREAQIPHISAPLTRRAFVSVVKVFTNHWSKQHGRRSLSGDMKGRKMESRQKSSMQAWESGVSTVGHLSSAPASADVTVSSMHLAVCSLTWFSALRITLGADQPPLSSLWGWRRRRCSYLFIAAMYSYPSRSFFGCTDSNKRT